MDFDWPAKPTLTLEDDPGLRSIAADYETSESKADKASDAHFLFWLILGSAVYLAFFVLGVVKLIELFGGNIG